MVGNQTDCIQDKLGLLWLFDVISPAQSFIFTCQLEACLLNPPVLDISDLWERSWKSHIFFLCSQSNLLCSGSHGTHICSLDQSMLSQPLGWLLLIYPSLGLSLQEDFNLKWEPVQKHLTALSLLGFYLKVMMPSKFKLRTSLFFLSFFSFPSEKESQITKMTSKAALFSKQAESKLQQSISQTSLRSTLISHFHFILCFAL